MRDWLRVCELMHSPDPQYGVVLVIWNHNVYSSVDLHCNACIISNKVSLIY